MKFFHQHAASCSCVSICISIPQHTMFRLELDSRLSSWISSTVVTLHVAFGLNSRSPYSGFRSQ